jgi:dimethylhistidine N-methyltransferase
MYNPSYAAFAPNYITPPVEPRFHQLHSENADAVKNELLAGLQLPNAAISPKFLYDELGSSLFTAITQLPEYYPTRSENEIVARHATEIARHTGPVQTLIDLGAGDCVKAERLFAHLAPRQYVPIDISVDYLRAAVSRLAGRYPDIEMVAVGMDFFDDMVLPDDVSKEQRVFFYPGSSIGNLAPAHAAELLARVRRECSGGGLIIGVDLLKPREILEPAYDDALGVTAAFNLNMLRHVNHIVGTDFDVAQWQHAAWFNEARSRIEMHLQARTDTTISWPGGTRSFSHGDRIHTENSYKYSPSAFKTMLEHAGFRNVRYWTDERKWFAVFSARA